MSNHPDPFRPQPHPYSLVKVTSHWETFIGSGWRTPVTIVAFFVGIAGWAIFTFLVTLSMCKPEAPWFCTETTLSERLFVLMLTLLAGLTPTLWIWFLPARKTLAALLTIIVFISATYASVNVTNVNMSGCRNDITENVLGCPSANS